MWCGCGGISGKPAALKAGFDFARGEVIISMDGDLQHDPEEIPRFLEKIEEGYDLVSGWRYQRQDHWLMRRVPSRIANWLMAKLSGMDCTISELRSRRIGGRFCRRFSCTANCTGLFRRWRVRRARGLPKCPFRIRSARAANPITELGGRFACFLT